MTKRLSSAFLFSPVLTPALQLLLAVSLAAGFAIGLVGCGKGDDKAGQDSKPVAVSTVVLQAKTVPLSGEFTGRTDSESTVELRARINGFLKKINFREGSLVKAGDLLFVIDPVEQENTLARTSADVAQGKAQLEYAKKERMRFEALVKQGAVSQQEYDAKVTNERQLAASVASASATASEARTNLGYTKVLAPQAGRIGKSNFKVGDLVGPGQNSLLATISATDTFTVTFNISERDYLAVAREYVEAKARGESLKPLICNVILADETVYPQPGRIDMADRAVDPSTGTLPVRAVFPNPDGVIKPGLFAKVRVEFGAVDNATVVPEQAVSDVQGAKFVFVVDKDGKAESRPVTLGARTAGGYIVQKGLSAGDAVIVDGWQKVRTGTPVAPAPAPAPAAAPAKP
ncbi:MAG TPA: efflux RND transporter periplasmic adaptor subunit [Humidesulfovibrio sp.]|uniref:efflux RND transporter periplasmic adaptor subunit n=1 Tax=Humidesulfovibrio sp. TaxID=2910988 RepID=UPI002CFD54C5|nr:efflux RND transporter periplasmic adaptor subunit [Humidesulfovibrio sp.]HWR03826.1 efflux RND transporter periplasmic adaptor subunit [Humidesulfovibrio sp.]